jgi:hypothetical protein
MLRRLAATLANASTLGGHICVVLPLSFIAVVVADVLRPGTDTYCLALHKRRRRAIDKHKLSNRM